MRHSLAIACLTHAIRGCKRPRRPAADGDASASAAPGNSSASAQNSSIRLCHTTLPEGRRALSDRSSAFLIAGTKAHRRGWPLPASEFQGAATR